MSRFTVLLILLGILLLNCQETLARRGRGRNRSKSRVQIGLPITGKYRDPESDQYYNNNNVRREKNFFLCILPHRFGTSPEARSRVLLRWRFFQGAKILLASHFDLEYVLGHKIAFLCVARGNPRPHITWFKDGTEIYTHNYLHVSILDTRKVYDES